jgi:lipopolysaccharide/colanic/teichoic acid biosynthesis glycosyltransferase
MRSRLAELEAVPEGIGDVDAVDARERVVGRDADARAAEPRRQRAEVLDDQTRMRLPGGRERLLDADVQLGASRPEPAPAAGPQRLGLRDLLEPEQAAVERPGFGLAAARRGDLDVVDSDDRHRCTVYHRQVPVALEDTLITGFRRLASDAPHRRIDVELRTLDILLATVCGIIALPFALVIAVLMLATSGRPVLYRGERVGRRGRFFDMLKFRTMKPGAEARIGQHLGPELVAATDAELTTVGRWLKTTQLDEIPQLWNVLRGDMSFVGPRPIRPRFFSELAEDLPAYWQRLVVRPGLTGFAQVRRGYETSMAEKLAHDLEWIADRSVRLYLRTVFATGLRVLRQTFTGQQ